EIRRDRAKFRLLAANFNDDAMAANNFGDLDWFADGAMVYAFNEAVVNGRVGDLVKVETQFGYHVVEITGKKEPERRVRVATLERTLMASTYTVSQIFSSASRFAFENRNQEEFNNAVTEMALSKRIAEDITPFENAILGINAPREIIRWMYDPESEIGDVSQVFDTDGAYVVAVLTNIREEGTMPFDQARDLIEPLVRREKKADILEARLSEQLATTNDLNAIAMQLQTTVDTLSGITFSSLNIPLFGRDPRIVGAIFALEKGQISEPVRGDIAVYILKLHELTTRTPDDISLQGIERVLTNSFRSRAVREAYDALLNNSDIEDSRLLFY
ncbi:MAG TPA: peptidylprolyl isomerase, partial [Bacteroidales bacterium]|nr:peptidylprolyl isomerase [Bacteroidales bacterium]